ncbi:MAG: type III pantothenate kinase [Lachnospiraceae bacterium]|nr:type III pantothenate kinase [Lachnospiraceae bacterium]
MILAIDMGNTHIELGLVDDQGILMSERIKTDTNKTTTEYAVLLHTIFQIHQIDVKSIEGAIISSVVPPVVNLLRDAVKTVTGKTPLIVGPGVKNGLRLMIDNPKQLGSDFVVDAVGAIERYGAPLIIIDMGTATTYTYIDETKAFRGGTIMPGVRISLDALVSGTAQLPRISLDAPEHVVGTNTIASMSSGIVFGQASMLDGMIDRICDEMQVDAPVIATGGLSKLIVPHCRHKITIDHELMLHGLKIIYDRNCGR